MSHTNVLPECQSCQFYGHSNYVVCTIHPKGFQGHTCLDFRQNCEHTPEPKWAPEGYQFYAEDLIPIQPSRMSDSDRLALLETHPLFTGRCPSCGYAYQDRQQIHWDCPSCAWKDDSV